ncbi:transcription initiation factor IIA subunit 2 [Sphaeroforma arctica JP610]|uniref:Transcription initiation factor IIA subunit 2 n=1 Tax=Sphaeroforma arctica JP610 TaxID=667725 RepID=A0A0L0GEP3_9EUKA|nr:transcription initiation factor IIA subunit 2 [Sphaeroforma arctica JP610]KNC87351.1 transcription initiation factor IIA subunit 2 [Sphaeroforma arctica JP610]|eukprot:XP_014161253.1 transcription initiation factor IIA subunit 2 [Sphaeroforma arctica JP610]
MSESRNYELYRQSTLGQSLNDTLEELVLAHHISAEMQMKIFIQFDEAISQGLTNKIKSKCNFKGMLHTYNYCDFVWSFILSNTTFKTDNIEEVADTVKIVACDAKSM